LAGDTTAILRRVDRHRLAEERSLALHREVLSRLRNDRSHLAMALARVQRLRASGILHPHYADAWQRLLEGPFEDLAALLVDESEHARDLRQCTPFSGVVDQRTRLALWREVDRRLSSVR
jgi:hypothetical protein